MKDNHLPADSLWVCVLNKLARVIGRYTCYSTINAFVAPWLAGSAGQ